MQKQIINLTLVGIFFVHILNYVAVIKLEDSLLIVVTAMTGLMVAMQAWITKELFINEIRPAVEVSMLCGQDYGTRFQFLRLKEIPALVYIRVSIRVRLDGKQDYEFIQLPSKLTGKEPFRVVYSRYATNYYDFLKDLVERFPKNEIEATIETSLAPIFDDRQKLPFYTKHYRLARSSESSSPKWLDTCWSVSDPDIFV